MNIGIAANFGNGFSGGRIHAFLLGAEMAAQGHAVTFICNQIPSFIEELPSVPGSSKLVFKKLKYDLLRFERPLHFDLWLVVQERSIDGRFFQPVFENARRTRAKIALLTFETPNWQEAAIPDFAAGTEDSMLTTVMALNAHCISSTNTGKRWAQSFFSGLPKNRFHTLSPPILASFESQRVVERDSKLLVAFIRQNSPHKGFHDLVRLISPRLSGWKLVFVGGGRESIESKELFCKAKDAGVELTWLPRVSENEKHSLLMRARALLFPSKFEGFGLPPAEAGYWGTPTICYDLEVLREVYGEELCFADNRSFAALETALWQELSLSREFERSPSAEKVASFNRWKLEVSHFLEKVQSSQEYAPCYPACISPLPCGLIIVDQVSNWNKSDASASAGKDIEACHFISFENDLWDQEILERAKYALRPECNLPLPGSEFDDLKNKLIRALEATKEEIVCISEDLIVCPEEHIQIAAKSLTASSHSGIAIPIRTHFSESSPLHVYTAEGDQLASCGVFIKERLLDVLKESDLPGSRFHPIIDLSFLLVLQGETIGAIADHAERLPPRTSRPFPYYGPSGEGSWQSLYDEAIGITEPPISPVASPSLAELPQRIEARKAVVRSLAAIRSESPSEDLIGKTIKILISAIPEWSERWKPSAPYRTFGSILSNATLFSPLFLKELDLEIFTFASLAISTPEELPEPSSLKQLEIRHTILYWRDRMRFPFTDR